MERNFSRCAWVDSGPPIKIEFHSIRSEPSLPWTDVRARPVEWPTKFAADLPNSYTVNESDTFVDSPTREGVQRDFRIHAGPAPGHGSPGVRLHDRAHPRPVDHGHRLVPQLRVARPVHGSLWYDSVTHTVSTTGNGGSVPRRTRHLRAHSRNLPECRATERRGVRVRPAGPVTVDRGDLYITKVLLLCNAGGSAVGGTAHTAHPLSASRVGFAGPGERAGLGPDLGHTAYVRRVGRRRAHRITFLGPRGRTDAGTDRTGNCRPRIYHRPT